MSLTYRYKTPAVSGIRTLELLAWAQRHVAGSITDLNTEYCYYIDSSEPLSAPELELLRWLLSETFEPEKFSGQSFLSTADAPPAPQVILEVGPRMNFTTAWSTNAVSVCHACGLTKITRIERSRRYRLKPGTND